MPTNIETRNSWLLTQPPTKTQRVATISGSFCEGLVGVDTVDRAPPTSLWTTDYATASKSFVQGGLNADKYDLADLQNDPSLAALLASYVLGQEWQHFDVPGLFRLVDSPAPDATNVRRTSGGVVGTASYWRIVAFHANLLGKKFGGAVVDLPLLQRMVDNLASEAPDTWESIVATTIEADGSKSPYGLGRHRLLNPQDFG